VHFDYELVPESGDFDLAAQQEIADFINKNLVAHQWSDYVFTVFRNDEIRALSVPYLIEHPNEGDWLNGYIKVESNRVVLGLVPDDEMLPQFYRLAQWLTSRWAGTTLTYAGEEQPLESLLPGRG
jgi:hypothetical protein